MKKYHTLLVVGITIALIALLTWFIPITYLSNGELISGEKVQAGIVSVTSYSLFTFYNFIYVFIYLLFIGGLYGLLSKCSAYRVLLDKIVNIASKAKAVFLVLTVVIIATIVAFTGYTFEALIFLPFIAAVVLLLGYDRITAGLVTVGSISAGVIGSLFGKLVAGKINSVLESITYTDYIIPKLIVLVVSCALLILFVILYAKKKSVKEDVEEGFLVPKKVTGKNMPKVWPLVVIFVVATIIYILAGIDWTGAFNVSFFNDALTKINSWPVLSKYVVLAVGLIVVLFNVISTLLKNVKVSSSKKKTEFMSTARLVVTIIFAVFAFLAFVKIMLEDVFGITIMNKALEAIKIDTLINDFTFEKLLGSVVAFGSWTYNEYLMLILVIMFAIKLVYHVKFAEVVENVGAGFKKVLYSALVVLLSYTVLILMSSHPIGLTIINTVTGWISSIFKFIPKFSEGLNVVTYPFATLFSSLFNSDFAYYEYGVLNANYVLTAYTGDGVVTLAEFITQTMYGFAMYFAPTSVILLFTLSFLDIKYTTWLKKVWLLLVILLIAINAIYFFLFGSMIIFGVLVGLEVVILALTLYFSLKK